MRANLVLTAVAAVFASAGGSACAMTPPERQQGRCHIAGAEKLAGDSGGSDALCAEIQRAIAERAPGVDYSVEVRFLSASRVSAILTTGDGRRLPEMHHASMDRKLGRSSFARFADAIAGELARAVAR